MIEQEELEKGIMRVVAGPEKKARLLFQKEQRITAYHEIGHGLVGHFLEDTHLVHKIIVVSRGQALGLDDFAPDRGSLSDDAQGVLEQIAMTLGGRAAEELVWNEATYGRRERSSRRSRRPRSRW